MGRIGCACLVLSPKWPMYLFYFLWNNVPWYLWNQNSLSNPFGLFISVSTCSGMMWEWHLDWKYKIKAEQFNWTKMISHKTSTNNQGENVFIFKNTLPMSHDIAKFLRYKWQLKVLVLMFIVYQSHFLRKCPIKAPPKCISFISIKQKS